MMGECTFMGGLRGQLDDHFRLDLLLPKPKTKDHTRNLNLLIKFQVPF